MNRSVLFVVLGLALFPGCGNDGGGTGRDSGSTPGLDSGTPIPGADSGTPIPGTDSGTPGTRPMGIMTDPDPGQVACGSMTCNVPAQICCTSFSGQMCVAPGSCGGGFAAPAECDGPEDCSGAENCCAPTGLSDLTTGTTCEASCGSRFPMCQTDADCSGGQTCFACRPPGGMGGVVGLCGMGRCPGSYTSP